MLECAAAQTSVDLEAPPPPTDTAEPHFLPEAAAEEPPAPIGRQQSEGVWQETHNQPPEGPAEPDGLQRSPELISTTRTSSPNALEGCVRSLLTIYFYSVPAGGELVFHFNTMVHLLQKRLWYSIPLALNEGLVTRTTVVRARTGDVPVPSGSQWQMTLNYQDYECSHFAYSHGVDNSWTFTLSSIAEVNPSYWSCVLLITFSAIRWSLIFFRGTLVAFGYVDGSRLVGLLTFVFWYVALCVMSVSLIGIELSDCVEWTPFEPATRLIMMQPNLWLINASGALFAIGLLFFRRKAFCWGRTTHFLGGDPFKVFIYLFFFLAAFLGALIVLMTSVYKPWTTVIWVGILFFIIDMLIPRKFPGTIEENFSEPRSRGNRRPRNTRCSMSQENESTTIMKEQLLKLKSYREGNGGGSDTKRFVHLPGSPLFNEVDGNGQLVTPEPMWAASRKQPTQLPVREQSEVSKVGTLTGEYNGELSCNICLENIMGVILIPCLHGNICHECMEGILQGEITRERNRMRREQRRTRPRRVLLLPPPPQATEEAPDNLSHNNNNDTVVHVDSQTGGTPGETTGQPFYATAHPFVDPRLVDTSSSPLPAASGERPDVPLPPTVPPQEDTMDPLESHREYEASGEAAPLSTEQNNFSSELDNSSLPGPPCPYCRRVPNAIYKIISEVTYEDRHLADIRAMVAGDIGGTGGSDSVFVEAFCVWSRQGSGGDDDDDASEPPTP